MKCSCIIPTCRTGNRTWRHEVPRLMPRRWETNHGLRSAAIVTLVITRVLFKLVIKQSVNALFYLNPCFFYMFIEASLRMRMNPRQEPMISICGFQGADKLCARACERNKRVCANLQQQQHLSRSHYIWQIFRILHRHALWVTSWRRSSLWRGLFSFISFINCH